MEPEQGYQKISGIKCEVKDCQYHAKDDSCVAGKIEVGPEHASDSSDTVCVTFQPNQNK